MTITKKNNNKSWVQRNSDPNILLVEEGAKAVMKKQKKEDVEEIKNWDEHLNSFHLG